MIRPYRAADLAAVYDICARTAADGGDGRGHNSSDRLVGDVFAAPYVTFEPEHAYVLEDGAGRAGGYVLGTADTARFVRRYRDEWLPAVKGRYGDDPRDQGLLDLLNNPERMLVPQVAAYPAHLHIDLLPQWQGRGQGRALMAAFLDGLRAAGVGGVHLGMSKTNTGARAFYDRLGFTEVATPDQPITFLARSTEPL